MTEKRDGHKALWGWFGLSRSSWLTVPRVLMHDMPDKWQADMARLLNEYEDTFSNQPDVSVRVQVTLDGKLIKTPAWMTEYRHPDKDAINALRTPYDPRNKLDSCETCEKDIYEGDMGFVYDDGIAFCEEHAPTRAECKAELEECIATGDYDAEDVARMKSHIDVHEKYVSDGGLWTDKVTYER